MLTRASNKDDRAFRDGKGRLRKRVEYYSDGADCHIDTETRYLYDGWRVIQERSSANAPTVSYTRGTDLSSSLEGAGGIGGLLARSHGYASSNGNWYTHNFYHADGNGNITYLVNSSQALAASYRYDPFGNTIATSGTLATANVYRFSSKESHDNSGLYYYGYRFYNPSLQRWVNRDPIYEHGDLNLYRFALNDPIAGGDYYGLAPGGPYHPPDGVSLKCYPSDSCARLSAKMALLMKVMASHTGWDRKMPPPRGGGRHSDELDDLWRAYARCQEIHAAKNCQEPKPPPVWDRVLCKVPGSDEVWDDIAAASAVASAAAALGAIAAICPECIPIIIKAPKPAF